MREDTLIDHLKELGWADPEEVQRLRGMVDTALDIAREAGDIYGDWIKHLEDENAQKVLTRLGLTSSLMWRLSFHADCASTTTPTLDLRVQFLKERDTAQRIAQHIDRIMEGVED